MDYKQAKSTARDRQGDARCFRRSVSGQAFVELVAGLVVIMVLLCGFVLLTSLIETHNSALSAAQLSACDAALMDEYSPALSPTYISGWSTGPDDSRYTRDDVMIAPGSPSTYIDELVDYADPLEAESIVPGNAVSALDASGSKIAEFRLVPGYSLRSVSTLPAVRSLFYARDTITVEGKVWMTWTKGIY